MNNAGVPEAQKFNVSDGYVKVILTVIALCLVWISVNLARNSGSAPTSAVGELSAKLIRTERLELTSPRGSILATLAIYPDDPESEGRVGALTLYDQNGLPQFILYATAAEAPVHLDNVGVGVIRLATVRALARTVLNRGAKERR
ncbi:MAG: hypothetical protein BMS9Abin37_2037 [Acidobacteriota bacterium]|nr:MAG: hypothetical protein BMS9Abin37_2037 [Acidobacteriota bacterium]